MSEQIRTDPLLLLRRQQETHSRDVQSTLVHCRIPGCEVSGEVSNQAGDRRKERTVVTKTKTSPPPISTPTPPLRLVLQDPKETLRNQHSIPLTYRPETP